MLNIVGYRLPVAFEDDLLNYELTEAEQVKHKRFYERHEKALQEELKDAQQVAGKDFGLTEQLTPDDLRQLCLAEDELSRKGSFLRLFPSRISQQYLPYFQQPLYYSYLLNEWQRKYADQPAERLRRLRRLCDQALNVQGARGSPSG